MAEQKPSSGNKFRIYILATGLILAHLIVSYTASQRISAVVDEPYHISRGAGLVFFHDFTFAVSHPPLINFLNALPLLSISDLKLPDSTLVFKSRTMDPSDRRKAFAQILLQELNTDTRKIINRARIPTMFLSAIFAWLVFIWAKQLFGEKAGLVALFLYCIDPNIMAHSNLATNDLGASLFILLSIYLFLNLLKHPNALNLALASLFLGLAQLTKFTAILLYPLFIILWLLNLLINKKQGKSFSCLTIHPPQLYISIYSLAIIFALSLVIIWAGYGFQQNLKWNFLYLYRSPICELPQLTAQLKCRLVTILATIPIPPRTFYYGLARTLLLTEQHENLLFFLGKTSQTGWWYYYPVLFLIKTPIPVLILFSLALLNWKKFQTQNTLHKTFIITPIIWFFLCFLIFNRKEIGIRHIILVYPLSFILISGIIASFFNSVRKKMFLSILFLWLAISSLLSFPDYLTYFNEAVLRSRGGLKISVLGEDWGQGIMALAQYQKKYKLYPLYYQPYGIFNPESYGLISEELNCEPAKPGFYAIHLAQMVRPLKNPELNSCLKMLKPLNPDYKVNGTIMVWKITPPK